MLHLPDPKPNLSEIQNLVFTRQSWAKSRTRLSFMLYMFSTWTRSKSYQSQPLSFFVLVTFSLLEEGTPERQEEAHRKKSFQVPTTKKRGKVTERYTGMHTGKHTRSSEGQAEGDTRLQ